MAEKRKTPDDGGDTGNVVVTQAKVVTDPTKRARDESGEGGGGVAEPTLVTAVAVSAVEPPAIVDPDAALNKALDDGLKVAQMSKSQAPKSSKSDRLSRWEANLDRLVKYIAEHGNCRVPQSVDTPK